MPTQCNAGGWGTQIHLLGFIPLWPFPAPILYLPFSAQGLYSHCINTGPPTLQTQVCHIYSDIFAFIFGSLCIHQLAFFVASIPSLPCCSLDANYFPPQKRAIAAERRLVCFLPGTGWHRAVWCFQEHSLAACSTCLFLLGKSPRVARLGDVRGGPVQLSPVIMRRAEFICHTSAYRKLDCINLHWKGKQFVVQ